MVGEITGEALLCAAILSEHPVWTSDPHPCASHRFEGLPAREFLLRQCLPYIVASIPAQNPMVVITKEYSLAVVVPECIVPRQLQCVGYPEAAPGHRQHSRAYLVPATTPTFSEQNY